MRTQLKAMQEDISKLLHLIAALIAFGCGFQIAGWILAVLTALQFLYSAHWSKKAWKKRERKRRRKRRSNTPDASPQTVNSQQ
jgi:hypothetical protein